ncbi:MAG: CRTAC1 family protein [Planctomycetota bacterium]|nr:CRTAC1 family protein [Planctomycetota bacterium]
MTEQNGGGIALLDYDRDLHLDVLMTDCGVFDGTASNLVDFARLFRGDGNFKFNETSFQACLKNKSAAMGLAAGDLNSDGFDDLFIAAYGKNLMYLNCGDGTFVNVTSDSMVGGEAWSSSVAIADLNGDGNLDVYVTNYVNWTDSAPLCHSGEYANLIQICSPDGFTAQPDELLINLGNGQYQESGASYGVADVTIGKGLAVSVADFTEDGLLDIFVANDTTPNSLFVNSRTQGYSDMAITLGVAVSDDGTHGASMGVACGDYNRDGYFDLIVSNFRNQSNDVFAGLGQNGFMPASSRTGIDLASRDKLAFGVVFQDFDLDGWPDLFVANGHIWDFSLVTDDIDYEMTADVLQNVGGQTFHNVSSTAGDYFAQKWLGRAVAAGHFDNDGAADLIVQHVGKPTRILRNASTVESRAVLLDIVGTEHCRQPLGCRVIVSIAGQNDVVHHIPSGGSFQASHDRRIPLRIPDGGTIDSVTICWPDGTTDSWQNIATSNHSSVVLIEGDDGVFLLPADDVR